MKLTNTDYKLLSYLYQNKRESLTNISKKLNISKEKVNYKIKKYINSGLIIKFATIFNYNKLGYHLQVIILLKCKNKDLNIKNDMNCISKGRCYGKYNLYLNCIFKDELEIQDYLTNKLKDLLIYDHLIIKPILTKLYPLKFLKNNKENIINSNLNNDLVKLSKNDKLILLELEKNYRTKIIEISKNTDISCELIIYNIKKYYKEGIISGHRLIFDMSKLNYSFSLLLCSIKNLDTNTKQKIMLFCNNHNLINSLVISINNPNVIIQLFHENVKEIQKTIDELNKLFINNIDIELMLVEDKENINTLPFM